MDDKTLTALKGSIAKWDAIADGTGADKGGSNCPLCKLFAHNEECDGCPVYEKTGYPDCNNSPYFEWWEAYYMQFGYGPFGAPNGKAYATTDDLKAKAREEADFLRSLLPEETK